MSALLELASPRRPFIDARRFGAALVIPAILAIVAAGLTSAGRPPGVLRVSAADAARSGALISLLAHPVGNTNLLEVRAPGTAILLAVSRDGSQAALADLLGQTSGSLTLARADGSQLRLSLPGLLAAGFAPDGSWIAIVDGRGALWRVDTSTGDAAQVGDGPFLGSPIATADGSLVLLAVSSIEAPFRSRVVRVAPSSGAVTPISDEQLDYAGYPLADGGVAVVTHRPDGTIVRRLGAGAPQLVASLEPGAVNVVVAPDGRRIAYELAGGGVVLRDGPGATPRPLGAGSHPCFALDSASLLVRRGSGSVALALDGSVLAITQQPSAIAGAAGCLP